MEIKILKRIYMSYKDDNDVIVSGYFDLVDEDNNFIKFKTDRNIVAINKSRIIKIKEIIT